MDANSDSDHSHSLRDLVGYHDSEGADAFFLSQTYERKYRGRKAV